jgi:hypothetical protein
MYIGLNKKYGIKEHFEVLMNIELILKDFRLLYICEYSDILSHVPNVAGLIFQWHKNRWYIFKLTNAAKIFIGNNFLLGIALNYLEPSFNLFKRSYHILYYVAIADVDVILYSQCITDIDTNKIECQVKQISQLLHNLDVRWSVLPTLSTSEMWSGHHAYVSVSS